MKAYLPPLLVALLLVVPSLAAHAQSDPALREDGVLYFDDNLPGKITATLKAPTTVYSRRDFNYAIAYLSPGQAVELVGMSPDGYLLKGNFRNNTVTGWIKPDDLPSGIDPALIAQAQKNQQRHDAIAIAIANKRVIQGMTPDEVRQSLGKPDQTSSRTDASGTLSTWVFTTYRLEPQNTYTFDTLGRPVLQTYYVKISTLR